MNSIAFSQIEHIILDMRAFRHRVVRLDPDLVLLFESIIERLEKCEVLEAARRIERATERSELSNTVWEQLLPGSLLSRAIQRQQAKKLEWGWADGEYQCRLKLKRRKQEMRGSLEACASLSAFRNSCEVKGEK